MPIPIPMDMPKVVNAEVVIDGRADEAAWSQATEMTGFITHRPKPGLTPVGDTRVLLMCTDEALYVHFQANDPNAGGLRYGLGRRDSRRSDDQVGMLLDPLGTGERAVLFIANPLGVQLDGTLVRGEDSELVPWRGGWSSWDARWTSTAVITKDGYAVEFEIPWSSIRHPEQLDQVKMLFFRRSASSREMSTWPALDPAKQGVLTQAVHMGGPGLLPKNKALSVQPELTVTHSDQGATDDRLGIAGVAPGLTMKYAPTPELQVLATFNPDFSQVESDETKIDVNQRYTLRYEEKRPFFLEGQEWFSHPMNDLTYTRTMVTPLYGLRATSENGPVAMAVVHVLDRQPSASVSEGGGWTSDDLEGRSAMTTVARLRWSIAKDNMVGLIVSDRNILGSDMSHHLIGIDGRYALGDAINIEATILGSTTRGADQDEVFSPASVLRAKASARHIKTMVEAKYISAGFRAENGFVPISDAIALGNETELFVFPNWKPIPRIFMTPTRGTLTWQQDGALRDYQYRPGVGFWTKGGALLMVDADVKGESFADQWFDTVSGSVMGGGTWTQWLRTWVRAGAGEGVLYDLENPGTGFKQQLYLDLSLQPFPMLRFGPSIGWERFSQGDRLVHEGEVLRVKLEIFATPTLWNRWIYDNNSFQDSESIESLLAWEHTPGRAVYLGGRTGVNRGTKDLPSPTKGEREWTLFAKMSWVFDG